VSRGDRSAHDGRWLLEPGPDDCAFCARAYRIEVAYYCIACDRPICPLCAVIVRERRGVLCPECAEGGTG
jgi:hypothetical protein